MMGADAAHQVGIDPFGTVHFMAQMGLRIDAFLAVFDRNMSAWCGNVASHT